MYNNNLPFGFGAAVPAWLVIFGPFFVLLMLWSFFWKGLALWHSSKRSEPWWFVILLFINTVGILEIIYLFGVAKLKWAELFSKNPPHHQ